MPASPVLYHTGLGVIAAISVLGLLAAVLTLSASIFILWRYRRSVARFMSARSGATDHPSTGDAQRQPARGVHAGTLSGAAEAARLFRLMTARPRQLALQYALAGALFALVMSAANLMAFSQTQINPLRAATHPLFFLFVAWTYAWPIVLTTNIVAAGSRLSQGLLMLGYFAILVAIGGLVASTATEVPTQWGGYTLPAWSGETPLRLAGKWALSNLLPTSLLVMFRQRRLRAVAPLVLSFMTFVVTGVLGIMVTAYVHTYADRAIPEMIAGALGTSVVISLLGYFFVLFVAACGVFGALGWRLLTWLRGAYLRKSVSDQSLAIDALWLIFASYYAVVLAFAGPGWAVAALLAFILFKAATFVALGRLRPNGGISDHAPTLLVLRVFSLGRRSETLFDAVTQRWRHIGNVQLIAGTDLALSTVAPHRFLAFVSGKLHQLFIRDGSTLARGVADLDAQRDADGRYRINDFFCHADTWQLTLSRLIDRADVVLMDLRNFSQSNAGCTFEINALLNTVALTRLVFVVDATTDKPFLQNVLNDCWRTLSPDSPNAGRSPSALSLFDLRTVTHRQVGVLLQQLSSVVL